MVVYINFRFFAYSFLLVCLFCFIACYFLLVVVVVISAVIKSLVMSSNERFQNGYSGFPIFIGSSCSVHRETE